MVLTNHGSLGDTGKDTGFYLSEAAHPHEVFTKAGYEVVFASPDGGFAPVDPKSLKDPDEASSAFLKKFVSDHADSKGIKDTLALGKLKASDYRGIFFAGGHGTMWDFRKNAELQKMTSTMFEQGATVGAVCHGPAALINVVLSDGEPLVKGRKVAGFTNREEEAVGLTKVVPYLLETELKKKGAEFAGNSENFKSQAVRDGQLVTGQNPASATATAELFVEALKDSKAPK